MNAGPVLLAVLLGLLVGSPTGPGGSAALPRRAEYQAVQPLLSVLPPAVAAKVARGALVDVAPYLNAAFVRGGAFDLGGYTYPVGSRLVPAHGTRLTGSGTIQALPGFDDRPAHHDNLQMMLQLVDGVQVERGVVFDGGSIRRPGFWLTGARNVGPISGVVLDATFRNMSFNGIDITRNQGSWRNQDVAIGATVDNVGWIGANIEGVDGLVHDDLHVSRTGFHAIYVGHSSNVRGARFTASKAQPPYRIYDGPGGFGGQEKGFLFGHFSTRHATWTDFILRDNRHAGYDGFGIGEDGPLGDPESEDIHVQGEIWHAGLFGLDVSSGMDADVRVFYPARQGIQFGLDLGGTLEGVRVTATVVGNAADEAARFSATGTAARQVLSTAGSPVIRIVGGTGFHVVAGQFASGPALAPETKVVRVDGARVTLDRPALASAGSARSAEVRFRASIRFADCLLSLRVADATYGVGLQSDVDGLTTYRDVRIAGDLSAVSRASLRPLNGPLPHGVTITARRGTAR